jgi:hypothetical protein
MMLMETTGDPDDDGDDRVRKVVYDDDAERLHSGDEFDGSPADTRYHAEEDDDLSASSALQVLGDDHLVAPGHDAEDEPGGNGGHAVY